MPITQQAFNQALSKAITQQREKTTFYFFLPYSNVIPPINLLDLFPEALEEGRLKLEGIDFGSVYQALAHINFSGCDIKESDFSGLKLEYCTFEGASLDDSTANTLRENAYVINNISDGCVFIKLRDEPIATPTFEYITRNYYRLVNKNAIVLHKSSYYYADGCCNTLALIECTEKNPKEMAALKRIFQSIHDGRILSNVGIDKLKLVASITGHAQCDKDPQKDEDVQVTWMKKRLNREGDFINYDFLLGLGSTYPNTEFVWRDGDFFFLDPKEAGRKATGWKLHLSVKRPSLEAAFDCIAPILHRYRVKYKVIDKRCREPSQGFFPQQATSFAERLLEGAQFTIYLGTNPLDEVGTLEMVQTITDVLVAKGISTGVIPVSDVKTISPYFSLRHDKADIPPVCSHLFSEFSESQYVSARYVGRHFNPFNVSNPFQKLVLSEPGPFSLLAHFEALPLNEKGKEEDVISKPKLFKNLKVTLLAYLREYLEIDSMSISDFSREIVLKDNHADRECDITLKQSLIMAFDIMQGLAGYPRARTYDSTLVTDEFAALISAFNNKVALSKTQSIEPIKIGVYN